MREMELWRDKVRTMCNYCCAAHSIFVADPASDTRTDTAFGIYDLFSYLLTMTMHPQDGTIQS